jgi:predicted aspartyl protease
VHILHLYGKPFTTGRSTYSGQSDEGTEQTEKIWVKVRVENFDSPFLAQLDTGAAWSILNSEIAEYLGLFEYEGEEIKLSSRRGFTIGKLVKTTLVLLADEGKSLRLDATVFVSRDWDGPSFVGYSGLLEHIRFALDCPKNHIYFGLSEYDSYDA